MSNKGGLLFIGIIGIIGIAALLASRSGKQNKPSPVTSEWQRVINPPPPVAEISSPRVVLENEQHVTIRRGPDRLIEEMTIHRKVISYDGGNYSL